MLKRFKTHRRILELFLFPATELLDLACRIPVVVLWKKINESCKTNDVKRTYLRCDLFVLHLGKN